MNKAMSHQRNPWPSLVRRLLADHRMCPALFVIVLVLSLVGCATEHRDSQSAPLLSEQYRQDYPRRYLDNINPWDRSYAEYLYEQQSQGRFAPGIWP